MKKIFLIIVFCFLTTNANAAFTIFACEMEWATLAREIAGSKAVTISATAPLQDPSKVKISRDLIKNLSKADMVFCSGGGLEKDWLSDAITMSKNEVLKEPDRVMFAYDYASVRPMVSSGDAMSERRAFSRVHLNPHNLIPIAAEFTRRISIFDKVHDYNYQKSNAQFEESWNKMIPIWEKMALPLQGQKVVVFDDSWKGLTNWLGLVVVDKVDLKKDAEKNKLRLQELADKISKDKVLAIIVGINEDQNFAMKLGKLSKTDVVLLPFTVGGGANSGSLQQMFITSVNLLLAHCPKNSCSAATKQ
jgi:zinc/manganese transport system substrate-binding protein